MKKENMQTIVKIVERADNMGLLMFDRLSLMMDMDCAAEKFNLRLDDMLEADNFNFSHDVVGIQNNINRQTKEFENFFVPRFARG